RVDGAWSARGLSWVSASEGMLDAGDHDVFGLAVSGRGASGERRVLVVHHHLDGAREVPVDAHAPRLRLARGAGRVGEHREAGIVEADLAVAGGQLEGAERARLQIEGLPGGGAPEGVLLAGEKHGAGGLPGGLRELGCRARAGHRLPRLDVLA